MAFEEGSQENPLTGLYRNFNPSFWPFSAFLLPTAFSNKQLTFKG